MPDLRSERRALGERPDRLRWVLGAALPLCLSAGLVLLLLLPRSLNHDARLVLGASGIAAVLWATTRLNAAHVALSAALLLALSGVVPAEDLYAGLASEVVWLMIGAFVISSALRHTGVATVISRALLARGRTVGGAMLWLTAAIVPLALVIPSTSARAAMAMPLYRDVVNAARDRRVTRAFAVLVPNVVLLSSVMTILAAGSHLIAVDLLEQATQRTFSYLEWAMYGVPFGVACCFALSLMVSRMFLTPEARARPLRLPRAPAALDGGSRRAVAITAAMVMGWVSQPWHGVDAGVVTVAGALLLTSPGVGVIAWSEGLKAVSWNLILFLAAGLTLGRSLISSGAAEWLTHGFVSLLGSLGSHGDLTLLLFTLLVTTTAHIYIPSHAGRAAALIPPLLYVATATGADPLALVFLGSIGLDYCSTFPVSSKALMLYQGLDGEPFQASDLLRLSAILLPTYIALILVFYVTYWRMLGLIL